MRGILLTKKMLHNEIRIFKSGICVTFNEAGKSYQSDRLSSEKFFPHFLST